MSSREPLLLIHGFTDTGCTWAPLTPLLEDRFAVIAPTLLGHLGGPAAAAEVPDPLGALVTDLERTLDAHGAGTAHVVGNSLGGWLALELAARGRARSVTALSPAFGWTDDGGPEEQRVARLFARTHRVAPLGARYSRQLASRPRLRRAVLRDAVAHGERISPAVAQAMLEGAAGCELYPHIVALVEAGGYRNLPGPIEVPACIAWGTRDRILPKPGYSPYFRHAVPDAEWVDLDDCGHLPHHDDPHLVARTVLATTERAATSAAAEPAARA